MVQLVKNSPANAGDMGSIPGLGTRIAHEQVSPQATASVALTCATRESLHAAMPTQPSQYVNTQHSQSIKKKKRLGKGNKQFYKYFSIVTFPFRKITVTTAKVNILANIRFYMFYLFIYFSIIDILGVHFFFYKLYLVNIFPILLLSFKTVLLRKLSNT